MPIYNPCPTIFLDNKFTNAYFFIIHKAQSAGRRKLSHTEAEFRYFERHHIVPKTLGGSDEGSNLVLLTAFEHFVCHWFLTKMVADSHERARLVHALRFMRHKDPNSNVKQMARLYDLSKQDIALASSLINSGRTRSEEFKEALRQRMTGERNIMYGKTHSPETIEKMSQAKRGANNPNSHGLSDDHKRKIGTAHKGKIISEKHKHAISESSLGNAYARKPIYITMPDGVEIFVPNRKKFCADYGYTISDINIGLRNGSYKGLKFRRP